MVKSGILHAVKPGLLLFFYLIMQIIVKFAKMKMLSDFVGEIYVFENLGGKQNLG